jgi:DNA repair exonuclease SbcCD ATPase subunit
MKTMTPPLKRRTDYSPVIMDEEVFTSSKNPRLTSATARASQTDDLDHRLERAQVELAALQAEQIAEERRREESTALEQTKKEFSALFTQLARESEETHNALEREEEQLKKRHLAVREALRRLEPILNQLNRIDPAVIKLSTQKAPIEQAIERLMPLTSALEPITHECEKATSLAKKSLRGTTLPLSLSGWLMAGFAFTLPLIITALGLYWWWQRSQP